MFKFLWPQNKEVSDSDAENSFLAEKWHYYSGFSDLEKIKTSLINFKFYKEIQKNLEYYCTESMINNLLDKNILNSKSCKKMIRQGIPIKYTKDLLLKLFQNDKKSIAELYNTRFNLIFKNFDTKFIGNHVPYLSNLNTIEENLPEHFLNILGQNQVKELLWLLYSLVASIEYCPLLIKMISFLLIFFKKDEVFCICKSILMTDSNDNDPSKLKFRLRFNLLDHKKLINSFIESIPLITNNTGKHILDKFNSIGFKTEKLIESMFFNMFYGYLNFLALHRLFFLYMNEGIKIFYRVAYSLLKLCKSEIMDMIKSDDVISLIKQKTLSIKDIDSIFSNAFSLKLTRHNNKYNEVKIHSIEVEKEIKRKISYHNYYYIPTIVGGSKILLDEDIFKLWKIFPENLKMKDAKLIFSCITNGYELKKLYEASRDPENSGFYCVLLIQTKNNEVFGCILSNPFDITRALFYRPFYSALFTLKPEQKKYEEIKNSDKIIFNSNEKLIIGDGTYGPGIQIDKEIMIGFNFPCDIYNSESFLENAKNDFQIEKLELFILY